MTHRLLRGLGALAAVIGATAIASVPVASADATSDYNQAYTLGIQAYEYGVPLLDSQRVFSTQTSVNWPDTLGHSPVNQFSNVRKLLTAAEKTVNGPNNDTLYSIAELDLSRQPVVMHAPAIKNRFWEFELLDPWTNNFYDMTSATRAMGAGSWGVTRSGNWAIIGPDFRGRLPRGVIRVRSPYNRVWVIGRTFVAGQADLGNVHRIQDNTRSRRCQGSGPTTSRASPDTSTRRSTKRRSRAASPVKIQWTSSLLWTRR